MPFANAPMHFSTLAFHVLVAGGTDQSNIFLSIRAE